MFDRNIVDRSFHVEVHRVAVGALDQQLLDAFGAFGLLVLLACEVQRGKALDVDRIEVAAECYDVAEGKLCA